MAYATRPIRNSWTAGGPVATLVVALLLVALAPASPAHARSRARVALAWEGVPKAVAVGDVVPLVLRITARTKVSLAVVEAVFREDWALADDALPWMGPLEEGQEVEVPVTVRLTGEGDYTVGARATAGEAVSGTAFHVRVEGGTAYLTPEPESVMRLRRAAGPDDLERMGVAAPPQPPVARAAVRAATSGTVSGNAHWVDPEGHPHPIRGARVQVFDDAPGGTILAVGITGVNGEYAHSVTAPSGRVSVRVMTEDGLGGLAVVVFPAGTPSARFILEAGPVALSGAVTLDLTTSRPTRGSPGSPGSSQGGALVARAFSVFDALVVYTLQAVALVGRPLPTVSASFPFPDPSGFGSGYNPTTKILQITLADAFDWDVLGHEMFHMIFDRVSPRPVDTAGPGLSGRELGLRGAWSEGLPDYFAVALQVSPMATLASFPGTLLNVGNARSEDTEDDSTFRDLESGQGSGCQSSFGYQTACTISALLWDVFDSDDDGTTVREAISGIPPIGVWNAITRTLPCDPCDRVDRLWAGILGFFGPFNPTVFDLADVFVVNRLAPEAKDPPDGTTVRGPNPPTFTWIKNGDSRSSDEYDDFVLAFPGTTSRSTWCPSRSPRAPPPTPRPRPSGSASSRAGTWATPTSGWWPPSGPAPPRCPRPRASTATAGASPPGWWRSTSPGTTWGPTWTFTSWAPPPRSPFTAASPAGAS